VNEYSLDLSSLRDAVQSLEDSIEVVSASEWFAAQSEKVQNTLVAGVIHNFEFVYELCIKMIRRQLELEAASPNEVDTLNFRNLLRAAGEKGMVDDVSAWFTYRELRNITSHTYDHEKAKQVWQRTLVFIDDARLLLQRLEARNA
jgi:nucleotidyltransferase substrate binding protein (TIGR01987 family)